MSVHDLSILNPLNVDLNEKCLIYVFIRTQYNFPVR